jgi:hypothetical protein
VSEVKGRRADDNAAAFAAGRLSSILTMGGLNGWIRASDFFRDRSIILDLDHNLVVDVTESLASRPRLLCRRKIRWITTSIP